MSLLEYPSVRSSSLRLDQLEDVFVAWAQGSAKPDQVDVGRHEHISMVELARRLEHSSAMLPPSACTSIGLPSGVTVAAAVATLLHATIDPDGPRCRSFRAASYYLRGLVRLGIDLEATTGCLAVSSNSSNGHSDVF